MDTDETETLKYDLKYDHEWIDTGSRRYEHVPVDNRDPIEAHPDIPHEWYKVQRMMKAEKVQMQKMIRDNKRNRLASSSAGGPGPVI